MLQRKHKFWIIDEEDMMQMQGRYIFGLMFVQAPTWTAALTAWKT